MAANRRSGRHPPFLTVAKTVCCIELLRLRRIGVVPRWYDHDACHDGLTNGTAFLGKERHALAQSLIRLLPLLAVGDRQGQKEMDPRLAADHAERWDAKSSNYLESSPRRSGAVSGYARKPRCLKYLVVR
jgi:hypothetical protein